MHCKEGVLTHRGRRGAAATGRTPPKHTLQQPPQLHAIEQHACQDWTEKCTVAEPILCFHQPDTALHRQLDDFVHTKECNFATDDSSLEVLQSQSDSQVLKQGH